MRDYENTAKALRCCRLTSARGCAECPYSVNNNEKCAHLLNDAADAIEELLSERDDWETIAKYKAKIIEKMESEQRDMMRQLPTWISVEERLPEFGERVLVCGRIDDFGDEPEYGIDIAYRYHAGVEHIDFYWDSIFDVTHWMPLPLPEPPKGVE